MQAYITMWQNTLNFTGKTPRSQYIPALLLHALVAFLLWRVCTAVGLLAIASLYGAAGCVSVFALHLRRIRDAGLAWFWAFLAFVPFIGFVFIILLMCKDSI